MSRNYIVDCYTCQHNGQETCKGCNTLLVGEDEPYENWQLREDLETKDQRISELEERLKNAIPKFKYHQVIYVLYNNEIIKGEIDCFDYFNKNYLVFLMKFDLGNEWFYEHEIFTTKEEAQERLKKL